MSTHDKVAATPITLAPAEHYLIRAIRYPVPVPGKKIPRWSLVARMFAQGSGYAAELCRKYGADPYTVIGMDIDDVCPTCGTGFEYDGDGE